MLNRRNFLRLGAASAAAGLTGTAVLSKAEEMQAWGNRDFSPRSGRERKAVPSACYQCVTRCPNVTYVEDGRIVKIEGQLNSIRSEGVMCAKGQGGANQPNDPDRLLYPLKRVGARGEGKWKPVSWDEALTEVAAHIKVLKDRGEPEKLMFHYGRMKSSTSKMVKTFLATVGTGTVGNHTSICEGGKWVAQEFTWGGHYDTWDFDNTRFVLNFGSNVFEAGTNHIPTSHRLIRAMVDRNVRMVTFDVRLSNTAAKSSEWIPVKPGTDLAIVLAMCNVVMSEGLYKGDGEAFLTFCKATADNHAGLQEKIASLKNHFAQYTPEWAEKISAVPADTIRRIAREFAMAHPACAISYRGAVAHYNGHDTERALQTLAAITGNIDNPGGRCKAVGPKWHYPKGPKNLPKARKLAIVDGPKGASLSPNHHMSHNVLKMIKDGSAGRPDIYMTYKYTPVYANGEVQENIDVLKDESLIPYFVVCSPFYDESAALADLILPEPTYPERWDWEDMVSPVQIPEFYIRQAAVKPMGETRDFGDVVCELAERLGTPLGYKTKEEFVRLSCDMTPEIAAVGGFEFMKQHGVYHDAKAKPKYFSYMKELAPSAYEKETVVYDEKTGVYWDWHKAHAKSREAALEKGYTHTKKSYTGYIGQRIGDKVYSGFKPDKVNKSGYLEIYSSLMEDFGEAPLPSWKAIPEHEQMAADDMILTTFKVATQIHSRSQNCKYLTELYHNNPAWINPAEAAKRGIKDGDMIKVKSAIGEISIEAKVTPAVNLGVIAISHHCGHWEYGRYASGVTAPGGRDDDPDLNYLWWKGSHGTHPNWIIANAPDPVNGQMRWMDTVVQVTKL